MHVCARLGITRPRYAADHGVVNSLHRAMPQEQPVRNNFDAAVVGNRHIHLYVSQLQLIRGPRPAPLRFRRGTLRPARDLPAPEKAQLKEANVLVERTFDALSLIWDHKGTWGLENPVHGSTRPELWQMPLMRQLAQLDRTSEVDVDQCRLGLSTKKPTKIMFSSHAVGFNELRGLKCDHPKGSHESTAGKRTRDASGEHWASRAQGEYPPHLCQVVAHSLLQGVRQRALESEDL